MQSPHHLPLHFFLNKELSEIYAAAGMRQFTAMLLGIFVPIYLLQRGYGISDIVIYNLYWVALYAALVPLATLFAAKIGLKHALLLNAPFLAAHFYLLKTLPEQGWPLWLVAGAYGASQLFYWPAFNIDFIRNSTARHVGQQLGTLNAVFVLIAAIAPLAAAILITTVGYDWMFLLAIMLTLLSPLPLFLSRDVHVPIKLSFRDVLHRDNVRNFAAFFGEGATSIAELVLWPLFVFLALQSILVIGGMASALLVLGSILVFMLGKLSDRLHKKTLLSIGAVSSAVTWAARTAFASPAYILLISGVAGAAQAMLLLPYNAMFYNRAAKKRTAELVVFKEVSASLGRASVLLVLLATGSFFAAFLLAGISSLSFLFF